MVLYSFAFGFRQHRGLWLPLLLAGLVATFGWSGADAAVRLVRQKADPYGIPRPGPNEVHVPTRTSLYLELTTDSPPHQDRVLPESVSLRLEPAEGEPLVLLQRGRFVNGSTGWLSFRTDRRGNVRLVVYVEPGRPLSPQTTYTVRVTARSERGDELPANQRHWRFTTEAAAWPQTVSFQLDLSAKTVQWHGGFFTGFCKPSFCTSSSDRVDSYRLMDQVRQWAPKAWSLQRDAWLTGMEESRRLLSGNQPNVVRERETRRIVRVEHQNDATVLYVEDFFGHQQYGIPSGRPLSADYHPGDEVLIADGVHDARAKVLSVDDASRTVRVTRIDDPPGGWKVDYSGPLPTREDPNAPGLFPPGGCYLRKFRPAGTPCYFWKRLDAEWDLVHRRFGRRLVVNFVDSTAELSVDGRPWTRPKDYAEWHSVVRAITSHLIERYGEATLDFYWSVFNEPDLRPVFWRSDWNELQKFYDYTVDAVLRAFEDHGYDSSRVKVGGLELGAIFGTHLKLREFLAHCSPTATAKGALEQNAAFADPRLDGKRSRRVEELCRKSGGRGSPCDFISVHAYNRSEVMAAKLVRAKEMALQMDPQFFGQLWVNSHESCPNWAPPPDKAANDSYLGNGYFPTWCADVARRLLQRASEDARYGFGETILTFWPWPAPNFEGQNACTRRVHVDDDGDGRADRIQTLAAPILHFLGLVAAMGERFWVLPERQVGGHVVSGFAARTDRSLRLLVYSHQPLDTQSRSEAEFNVQVRLDGVPWRSVRVTEYRFDKDHNSYFKLARKLRDQPPGPKGTAPTDPTEAARRLSELAVELTSGDRTRQLAALKELRKLGPAAKRSAGLALAAAAQTDDEELRREVVATVLQLARPPAYPADVVQQVEEQSHLRPTAQYRRQRPDNGPLTLTLQLSGNAADYVVVEPAR